METLDKDCMQAAPRRFFVRFFKRALYKGENFLHCTTKLLVYSDCSLLLLAPPHA